MKKYVIAIDEDNHGMIGIATSFKAVINFLLGEHWIDELFEVWDDDDQAWVTLLDKFGEDWEQKVRSMTRNEFERVFQDNFTLSNWELESEE